MLDPKVVVAAFQKAAAWTVTEEQVADSLFEIAKNKHPAAWLFIDPTGLDTQEDAAVKFEPRAGFNGFDIVMKSGKVFTVRVTDITDSGKL